MDRLLRKANRNTEPGDLVAAVAMLKGRLRAGAECRCGSSKWECFCRLADGHAEKCPRHVVTCPRCAGITLQKRIELAAYCGSEAARLVVGEPDWVWNPNDLSEAQQMGSWRQHPDDVPLRGWLSGLKRYGPHVLLRAALAAGRAVHFGSVVFECGVADCNICRALDACAAWLECPTAENREAWRLAWVITGGNGGGPGQWIPSPESRGELLLMKIRNAARLTSEQTVRAAVCKALCEWALGY